MSTEIGHEHVEACDRSRGSRTTTVVALRLEDAVALQLRGIVERSPFGYESVGHFVKNLIITQALRQR